MLGGAGSPRPALTTTSTVVHEDDGPGSILAGKPFATEGGTLDKAAADMVDALREYAQDWPRLSEAPNHRAMEALVTFVDASTDTELSAWLCSHP